MSGTGTISVGSCLTNDIPYSAMKNNIVQVTRDESVTAEFIEFPPDTVFMASIVSNKKFRNGSAFVLCQRRTGRKIKTYHLYEISPRRDNNNKSAVSHVLGPLVTKDRTPFDPTILGCALTSFGMIYLCCYDRDSVIAFDLRDYVDEDEEEEKTENTDFKKAVPKMEIKRLSCPQHIAVDPDDEHVLYVCGGRRVRGSPSRRRKFNFLSRNNSNTKNHAKGKIYKIKVKGSNYSKERVKKSFGRQLDVAGDKIWYAQLGGVRSINKKTSWPSLSWKEHNKADQLGLAGGVITFSGQVLLCPMYETVSESSVANVVVKNDESSNAAAVLQAAHYKTGEIQIDRDSMTVNDEESLPSQSTYSINEEESLPSSLRIALIESNGSAAHHLVIDLKDESVTKSQNKTLTSTGPFFDGGVTSVAHLGKGGGSGGYIAFINADHPRVLLLDDEPFKRAVGVVEPEDEEEPEAIEQRAEIEKSIGEDYVRNSEEPHEQGWNDTELGAEELREVSGLSRECLPQRTLNKSDSDDSFQEGSKLESEEGHTEQADEAEETPEKTVKALQVAIRWTYHRSFEFV